MNLPELHILEQDFKPAPRLDVPACAREKLEHTGLLDASNPARPS